MRQVSIYDIYTYGAFRSLDVFTVTGVPRREPWRPYGRVVSLVRALHELVEHAIPLHPEKLRGLLALVPRLSLRRHRAYLLTQIMHISGEAVQVSLDLGAVSNGAVAS